MKKMLSYALLTASIFLFVFALHELVNNRAIAQDVGIEKKTEVIESELPVKLIIPKLNVSATITHGGVTKEGKMVAPKGLKDVSWYKLGTVPGYKGSAVIAGHLDNALSLHGVFKNLDQLSPGDVVYVISGIEKLEFTVTHKKQYPYDNAPLASIFRESDTARLNLITCAGEWDNTLKTYSERLVVYSKLTSIEKLK